MDIVGYWCGHWCGCVLADWHYGDQVHLNGSDPDISVNIGYWWMLVWIFLYIGVDIGVVVFWETGSMETRYIQGGIFNWFRLLNL